MPTLNLYKTIFLFIVLFVPFNYANIIPLTEFTDKEYLGLRQWKFNAYSIAQYYFNDLNNLNKIDGNFIDSNGTWDYNVTKGVYALGVREDGTIGFRKNN